MQLDLPDWFFEALPMLHCRKCKKDVEVDSILASGIRKSIVDQDITAFFIEYECPHCDAHTTMELSPMTMEELTMEMLDKYTSADIEGSEETDDDGDESEGGIAELPASTCSSKISKSEYMGAIEMIRGCETHHDFMLYIGMTEDQIKEYAFVADKNIHNKNKEHENN